MPDAPAPGSTASPAPAAPASSPQTGAPPSEAAGAASPAQAAVRKLMLQVNGAAREMPEDVVVAHAQRYLAGEDKFREYQRVREESEKKAKERTERLKREWWEVAKEDGVDPDAAAREYILRKYGRDALTPDQLRAEKAEREAAETKAKLAEREAAEKKTAVEQHKTAALQDMRQRWTPALQKLGIPLPGPNEPLNPLAKTVLGRMADLEEQNLALGLRHPPEVLAELTREDLQARQAWVYGGLEGETLLGALGNDLSLRVARALVARRKTTEGGTQAVVVKPNGSAKANGDQPRDPATGQYKPVRFNRDDARAARALTPVYMPPSR